VEKHLVSTLGFNIRLGASDAGPDSGDGLFVRGQVDPGEIVAVYPGVCYATDALRYIPGYPKIDVRNTYLIGRYDGSVLDALPWGRGDTGHGEVGGGGITGEEDPPGLGVWPGPPLSGDAAAAAAGGAGEAGRGGRGELPAKLRRGEGWWWAGGGLDDYELNPLLSEAALTNAADAASRLERRHPLALAHFANHPPVWHFTCSSLGN